MNHHTNEKGFGFVPALIILAVLAVVTGVGWTVYNRSGHSKETAPSSIQPPVKNADSETAARPSDPYAGWKSYCDSIYKYCLKYPADWNLAEISKAGNLGGGGQVLITSPDGKTAVTYNNVDSHGGAVTQFNTVDVAALGHDTSLVGGYYATSGVVGNFVPHYYVVDSALLKTYPLTKGQASPFVPSPHFTNAIGNGDYQAFLSSGPQVRTDTEQQARDWFTLPDAQLSVLILRSLSAE